MPENAEGPGVSRVRWFEVALLLALLVLGSVIRSWDLGGKSFWFDELLAFHRSENLKQAIVECDLGHEPPLRYVIIHYLGKANPPEFYTRLPSFFSGVAGIAALWLLARMLFGRAVALMAAFLLTISPWHILHSQDMRMYSVMFLLWTLSLICFFAVMNNPKKPLPWLGLAVFNAANFYISYVAVFVMFAEVITLIGVVFLEWLRGRKDPGGETLEEGKGDGEEPLTAWGRVRPYATGMLIFAGFFGGLVSFWIHPFAEIFGRYLETDFGLTKPMITAVHGGQWMGWPAEFDVTFFAGLFDRLLLPGLVWRLVSVALCIGGLIIISRINRPFVCIAAVSFLAVMITMLFSAMRHFVAPRYVFFVLIFSTLATSVALITIGEKVVCSVGSSARRPIAAVLTIAFLFAAVYFAAPTVWRYMRWERQDWRGACRYLAENVQKPQPAVIGEGGKVVKKATPGEEILTGLWGTHLAVSHYAPDALSSTTIRNCLTAESTEDWIDRAEEGVWYVTYGPRPESLQLVISSRLERKASFPGLKGAVEVFRKREGFEEE